MNLALFTDHCSKICQTIVDEARNKCLIASVNLSIRFLDKRHPEFVLSRARAENKRFVARVARKSVVNENVAPHGVLEETQDVDSV